MAVALFDSFLNDQIILSKHKILALAAILISIKVDESETVSSFLKQISIFKVKKLSSNHEKALGIHSSGSTKEVRR